MRNERRGIPTRWGFPRSELDLIVGGNVSIESNEELLVALHEMKGPLYKLSVTAFHQDPLRRQPSGNRLADKDGAIQGIIGEGGGTVPAVRFAALVGPEENFNREAKKKAKIEADKIVQKEAKKNAKREAKKKAKIGGGGGPVLWVGQGNGYVGWHWRSNQTFQGGGWQGQPARPGGKRPGGEPVPYDHNHPVLDHTVLDLPAAVVGSGVAAVGAVVASVGAEVNVSKVAKANTEAIGKTRKAGGTHFWGEGKRNGGALVDLVPAMRLGTLETATSEEALVHLVSARLKTREVLKQMQGRCFGDLGGGKPLNLGEDVVTCVPWLYDLGLVDINSAVFVDIVSVVVWMF